jgi:ferric-dicitrate binding protein FerR (iron transport regulator)
MGERSSPRGELERLLMLLVEGDLAPADRQRLSGMLQQDPEARRYYVHYIELHAALETKLVRPPVILPEGLPVSFPDAADPMLATQGGQPHVVSHIVWSAIAGLSGVAMAVVVMIVLTTRGSHLDVQDSEVQHPALAHVPASAPLGAGATRDTTGAANDMAPGVEKAPGSNSYAPTVNPTAVARVTHTKGCRWNAPRASLAPGERLFVGQSLRLLAGVAEINFDVGAKVVLQAPANFDIESGASVRLSLGKASTEITKTAARGFKIDTPQATFVDQGTEFGVEVTPGGNSRIHVFQGRVDVAMNSAGGKPSSASRRLMANGGARMEGDSPCMTLIEDTGESFIRSIDESGRDEHVIAYWRFEDQPLGILLPDTRGDTQRITATTDSSFNGNDLFTFSTSTQPYFSGDVPATIVPQTAAVNRACLNNTVQHGPGARTRDVYTSSRFSHASPLDIQKITPAAWTIEASVKPAQLRGGRQTFLVRDGTPPWGKAMEPRLVFQITAVDRFAIRFVDASNRSHGAVAADLALQENHWYHTAATSDGRALRLYVDALDGRGYQLQATAALPETGFTALGKVGDDCSWSIGRGRPAGRPSEWFQGWIDEVRISDVARLPSEFLFARRVSKAIP